MRGFGRTFKRGSIWWIAYSYRGKEHRESAKSPREIDAKRLLRKRLGEIGQGTFTRPQVERVYVTDLLKLVEEDHIMHQRRSPSNKIFIDHIRNHFGSYRAIDVTPMHIDKYIHQRLSAGRAPGTVNRELNVLRRAYHLGTISNGDGMNA